MLFGAEAFSKCLLVCNSCTQNMACRLFSIHYIIFAAMTISFIMSLMSPRQVPASGKASMLCLFVWSYRYYGEDGKLPKLLLHFIYPAIGTYPLCFHQGSGGGWKSGIAPAGAIPVGRVCTLERAYYSFNAPVKLSDSIFSAAASLPVMAAIMPKNFGNSAPMKNCDESTRPL